MVSPIENNFFISPDADPGTDVDAVPGEGMKVLNNINTVKIFFRFCFVGVGPEIVDLGPLPGPTRPRGGLGKAPAGPPFDLH